MAQDVVSWGAVQPSLKIALPLMAKRIHGKKLKDSAVVTLAHIIDNYNDTFKQGQLEGWSAPGVEYLMEMQSLSESVVNENISLLVKLGLLTQIGGGNNRTHSNAKFIPNFEIAEAWVEERRAVRAKFQEELNVTIRNQSGNPDPIASGNHRNATGNPDDLTGNQDAANGNPDPTPSIIPSITPTIREGVMMDDANASNPDAGGMPDGTRRAGDEVRQENYSAERLAAVVTAYNNRADVGEPSYVERSLRKLLSSGWTTAEIIERIESAKSLPKDRAGAFLAGLKRDDAAVAQKPVEAPAVVAGGDAAENGVEPLQPPLDDAGRPIEVLDYAGGGNALILAKTPNGYHVGDIVLYDDEECGNVKGTIKKIRLMRDEGVRVTINADGIICGGPYEAISPLPTKDPWDGIYINHSATCATEIGAVVDVYGDPAPAVVTDCSGGFYAVLFRDGRKTTTPAECLSLARGEAA